MPPSKQENTSVKATHVVEKPSANPPAPSVRECTMDSAIRDMLPEGHPLTNALMWDYVERGAQSYATLTKAINGYEVRGVPRIERNATNLAASYWSLHSKYVAMTCEDVRALYGDLLGHVINLSRQYGELFMGNNSQEMKELVERMAGECGEPDEFEKNRSDMYPVLEKIRKGSLGALVTEWMTKLGYLPSAEPGTNSMKDRVSFQMNTYYCREDGLIDWCVRLINDFMQTARDKDMVDAVIKYDAANQSQFQIFKSCVLLGNQCRLETQPTTKLVGDWFADQRVLALINDPETNASVPRSGASSICADSSRISNSPWA